MHQIRYSAEPELRRPAQFLRLAWADLRAAPRPARALFVATLRARHRRAWLGYVWLAVPGLSAAALCAFAQARGVIAVRDGAVPYPVLAFLGMMAWQGFHDAVLAPLDQLGRSRQLITRALAAHEAVLGAALLQVLLNAAVRLALAVAALVLFAPGMIAGAWPLAGGMAMLIALGFGVGLLAAPLGLLYEDIGRLLVTALGFLFFLTPVLYPIPADRWFQINPVAVLLVAARGPVTGEAAGGVPVPIACLSVALPVLGWLLYRLARPHVVARLG